LGIAQRRISIKHSKNIRKSPKAKPLPVNIKTTGDWIFVKRMEKNLTPGQLAAKMGIASALVRAWEDGTSQPNEQQQEVLVKILHIIASVDGQN
jgi:DNA-binding transcriptional regulator YiaG